MGGGRTGGVFIDKLPVLLECEGPETETGETSPGLGSANALNISPLTNGNVSSENDNASSSAYTSNSLGRFNNPSVSLCIVSVGDNENVGIETAETALPVAGRLDLADQRGREG